MTKDCKSLAKTRDCHDFAFPKSRNDGAVCHTSAFEKSRSISKENTSSAAQNRDISLYACVLRLSMANRF